LYYLRQSAFICGNFFRMIKSSGAISTAGVFVAAGVFAHPQPPLQPPRRSERQVCQPRQST
jgi:hypothetical protein